MSAFRAFQIGWKTKAFAFNIFDRMPLGREVYFLVQRKVTRTVPRVLSPTATTARRFLEHTEVLRAHAGAAGLGSLSLFEFGAGWDLYGNLILWCLGVERQTVYDLTRWARPDQINIVLRHLQSDPPPGATRVPRAMLPERGAFESALRERYGIDYRAPGDAGATGLPDASFDAVPTTSVLEHVPPSQIVRILAECRRLLKPGGLMSHVIDYSDHFSHSDPSITPYNFLAFSEAAWRRYNPGIHHQNRLRHADYPALFEAAGLRVVTERSEQPDDAAAQLARIRLDPAFRDRPAGDLAPVVGHYVLVASAAAPNAAQAPIARRNLAEVR